jgi:hypothetical protein
MLNSTLKDYRNESVTHLEILETGNLEILIIRAGIPP